MKEQSHKNEMSAALRGDFDRLRRRGVAVTLAPGVQPPSETSEPNDAVAADEPLEQRRGWLGRLLGGSGSAA